jgi:uncharacterized membrane protein
MMDNTKQLKDSQDSFSNDTHEENNFNMNTPFVPHSSNKSIVAVIWTAIGLGFLNLIFVLGPYIGIASALMGLFAGALGITVGGVGILIATVAAPFAPEFINIPVDVPSSVLAFFGVGTTALGILFFIGVCYLGKYFCIGTMKYVKWTINIIKG